MRITDQKNRRNTLKKASFYVESFRSTADIVVLRDVWKIYERYSATSEEQKCGKYSVPESEPLSFDVQWKDAESSSI